MTEWARKAKGLLEPCVVKRKAYRKITDTIRALDEGSGDGLSHIDDVAGLMEQRRAAWDDVLRAVNPALDMVKAASLPPLEYRIIILRYIRGEEWQTVCQRIDRSRRHTLALHTQALERMGQTMKRAGE